MLAHQPGSQSWKGWARELLGPETRRRLKTLQVDTLHFKTVTLKCHRLFDR